MIIDNSFIDNHCIVFKKNGQLDMLSYRNKSHIRGGTSNTSNISSRTTFKHAKCADLGLNF